MSERRADSATLDAESGQQGLTTADLASTAPQQAANQSGANTATTEDATQQMANANVSMNDGQAAAASQQAQATASGQQATGASQLFPAEEAQALRSRWDAIQAGFVDEPRRAVEQADSLVADTMKRLAEVFSQTRSDLESQWGSGSDVSTEDLRLALQRYRSFFDRLLSV
ncbi:MAG TPA: hypothetical protein VFE42_25585 [Chloroflexota bacterium]|nr:hypothetical protein [Chloroflexota bacterium]